MRKNTKLITFSFIILSLFLIPTIIQLNNMTKINENPQSSALLDIVISPDGIWNPTTDYSRYRENEYDPLEPFLQWYYYKLDDFENHRSFAFCNFIYIDPINPENQGLMFLFSYISDYGNVEIAYYLPIDSLTSSNDMDFSFSNKFHQEAISDDIYHIDGLMDNPDGLWNFYITNPNFNENMTYSWDLTFTRIIGCFSQSDDTLQSEAVMWNSYCFDSEVSGIITMGNDEINVGGSNWRGYADTNWGNDFIAPSDDPENPAKYRWGWISVIEPDLNNPENDFALISAFADQGELLGLPIENQAVFASVYNALPNLEQVCYKTAYTEILGVKTPLIEECSDCAADCKVDCSYSADNFFTYIDNFGEALVPHHQQLILESLSVKIVTDIYVDAEDITRLLTPSPEGIYSNFEGLGADANVKIYAKTYKWWDVAKCFPNYVLTREIQNQQGGIEFGYLVDIDF